MRSGEASTRSNARASGTLAVGGHPIAYELRGSGVPIVLIAGTGYPGATWPEEIVGPLARRHTVLRFDHRGTGATPSSPGPYTTRLFARDAAGLMAGLGIERAHVLGHSMGGRVAQWIALEHSGRVRTLILAATGPGEFDPARPVTRGIPVHAAKAMIEMGYERYMRDHIAATFFTPEFREAHPDRVRWLHEAYWAHRPVLEDYLKHVVARQTHQTAERLGEIAAPTLVVVGDRDTAAMGTGVHTEQSDYLMKHLPNATLRTIAGTAHGFFWQDPTKTVEVLLEWTAGH